MKFIFLIQNSSDDAEIDNFASHLRTQVEIFVNRMKSNSSRGRSISNDSSVQNLFLNLTAFHSRLLEYIKKADDKRMWFEQLQDKLTQIKDSRAALDVLRQEHQEKLRQLAEEQERQRQMQMAYKLELMRKKKQEYLQYQRQLALQRIQEQEREMKMHQDQQKVMYTMGVPTYGANPNQFMPPNAAQSPAKNDGSPAHIMHGQFPSATVGHSINNYAMGQPMRVGNNYGALPGQNQQRFPIQPQPIYSSVGNPMAAQVPGINTMPQQYQNTNEAPIGMYGYMPPVNQDLNSSGTLPQSNAMPVANQMQAVPNQLAQVPNQMPVANQIPNAVQPKQQAQPAPPQSQHQQPQQVPPTQQQYNRKLS